MAQISTGNGVALLEDQRITKDYRGRRWLSRGSGVGGEVPWVGMKKATPGADAADVAALSIQAQQTLFWGTVAVGLFGVITAQINLGFDYNFGD